MPVISRFLGILIMMYYQEHGIPHFHVKYAEHKAVFSIEELTLMEGYLPKRVTALVLEWAFEHRQQLLENWWLARSEEPLKFIEPLV